MNKTLLERLGTGAISLKGRISEVELPQLVLPLTVEPTKPRLCHDGRFLNLWMMDVPFKLDSITNLPCYVAQNTYQTILDDKSGYDHLFLTEQSRVFFGIQWGGWIFLYNTLPFGWKISPSIYHSTSLMASNFFRSIGIPCSLYIDDRHNGKLQVSLDPLSSAEVQAFVISIRCAKCTAGEKSNGSIRRRTSARCMSISRTSLSFSRTSMDFSTLAKFDSLKLTETHW